MAPAFLGGISDSQGTVAYLNVAGGLVAIDLGSGAVKWRLNDDSEPVAASGRFLVTRRDLPAEPVIELRDTRQGQIIASLTAAQIPGFAAVSPGDPIEANIEETPGGPELRWRSERRYRGGAVPTGFAAESAASHGAVLLNAATGEARAVSPAAPPAERRELESLHGDSSTIAAVRDGDVHFALKQQGDRLVLEAHTAGGELLWRTLLGSVGAAAAGPLRE
jgi:hypothetical protein